jgi:hypothetical protein
MEWLPVKRWRDLTKEERRDAVLGEVMHAIITVICAFAMLEVAAVVRALLHEPNTGLHH